MVKGEGRGGLGFVMKKNKEREKKKPKIINL